MRQYDSANLLEVLFTCRGSVFPKVFFRSLLCAGLGGLSYWLALQGYLTDANVDLHTYVGVILGLLLVFRTNISYSRWEAGMSKIGLIAAGARDIMTRFCAYTEDDLQSKILRSEMHRLLVLLFATFKKSIHGSKNVSKDEQSIATEKELQMLYAASTLKQLVAVQWVRELLRKSSKIQEKDHVSRTLLVRMDDQLSSMMENFASSQRVAFTPMPFPYAQVVKYAVFLYTMTSPFAYAVSLGVVTPAAAFVMGMVLFGIEEIGVEIEGPFGKDVNDIRLKQVLIGLDFDLAMLCAIKEAPNGVIPDSLRLLITPSSEDGMEIRKARKARVNGHTPGKAGRNRRWTVGSGAENQMSPERGPAADGLPFGYYRTLTGPNKVAFDDILEAALGVGEIGSREAINAVYEKSSDGQDKETALLGRNV